MNVLGNHQFWLYFEIALGLYSQLFSPFIILKIFSFYQRLEIFNIHFSIIFALYCLANVLISGLCRGTGEDNHNVVEQGEPDGNGGFGFRMVNDY